MVLVALLNYSTNTIRPGKYIENLRLVCYINGRYCLMNT